MSEAASLSPRRHDNDDDNWTALKSLFHISRQSVLASLPSNILTRSRKTSDDNNNDDNNWSMNKNKSFKSLFQKSTKNELSDLASTLKRVIYIVWGDHHDKNHHDQDDDNDDDDGRRGSVQSRGGAGGQDCKQRRRGQPEASAAGRQRPQRLRAVWGQSHFNNQHANWQTESSVFPTCSDKWQPILLKSINL